MSNAKPLKMSRKQEVASLVNRTLNHWPWLKNADVENLRKWVMVQRAFEAMLSAGITESEAERVVSASCVDLVEAIEALDRELAVGKS